MVRLGGVVDGDAVFHVFDRQGRLDGGIAVDSAVTVWWVDDRHMWGTWRDEWQVPRLVRFTLPPIPPATVPTPATYEADVSNHLSLFSR